MTHRIIWKDTRNGEIIADLTFESDKQFRLFYINGEGKPQVQGKAPLRLIRGPMKEWADRWATEHSDEIVPFLKEQFPEFTLEQLVAALKNYKYESIELPDNQYNRRDAAVASFFMSAMLRAMVRGLEGLTEKKIVTLWEFSTSAVGNGEYKGIQGWLFRGGRHDCNN